MFLKAIADFVKRTTIGELNQMPYRYLNALYYELYRKSEYDKQHPKEAEEQALGEGLSELM